MDIGKLAQFCPAGEAEETLQAIILGDVDALVVEGDDGPQVYTLRDANEPYRILVERMSEAAVVLDDDGVILYCNGRLAAMLAIAPGSLIGRRFQDLAVPGHRSRLRGLLAAALDFEVAAEVKLRAECGGHLTARISAAPMSFGGKRCAALVVTDLSAQRRSARMSQAKEFTATILDQATQPIVVCDLAGTVTHASQVAVSLCDANPIGRRFHDAFPCAGMDLFHVALSAAPACEATLSVAGQPRHFLVKGAPLYDNQTAAVGCVITLSDVTALKAAKLEADQASRAKSRFLASASHDLRQPFQAMRLYLDVLMGMDLDPTVLRALIGLNGAVEAGSELLTALLDVSTFEAGTVQPKVEQVELAPLLAEVLDEHASVARERGLRLNLHCGGMTVRSDRILLKRMIRNLVQNALRYTDRGGILLGVRRRGQTAVIQVWDTGCGIAEKDLATIFEDFYQVANQERDRSKGLGLGLSIVQRMARLLDHRILVASRPGKGSTFSVIVPL